MTSLFPHTPVETYMVQGKKVYVKREDLCCGEGTPQFSKIRGLEIKMKELKEKCYDTVAVLDSCHSKAGWGTAWLARELAMKCVVFYPSRKGLPELLGESQINALEFGAKLVPLKAGMQAVLWYQSRKWLAEDKQLGKVHLLPNGLTLEECVKSTEEECKYVPEECWNGTVVISVSTGTIARGVANFARKHAYRTAIIAHMGYTHAEETVQKNVRHHHLLCIDEGYQYKDRVNFVAPFPCNPYYDLKAWKWLNETDLSLLKEPILFWNIGA